MPRWVRLVHEIEAKQFRIADKRLNGCGERGINPVAQADPRKSNDASRQRVERADIADICQVESVHAGKIVAIRIEVSIGGIVKVCDRPNGFGVPGSRTLRGAAAVATGAAPRPRTGTTDRGCRTGAAQSRCRRRADRNAIGRAARAVYRSNGRNAPRYAN